MGLGWFFVGYFSATVASLYLPIFPPLAFAKLLGYPMMIYALWQMAPYHRYLRISFYASFASLPFVLYYTCYAIGKMGLTMPVIDAMFDVMGVVYTVFTILFTALWLFALFSLSRELSHKKLMGCALRCLIFFGLNSALYLISQLTILFVKSSAPYFAIPVLLLRVISIFLNLYFIYLCYRYIGPQEEGNADSKEKGQTKGEAEKDEEQEKEAVKESEI